MSWTTENRSVFRAVVVNILTTPARRIKGSMAIRFGSLIVGGCLVFYGWLMSFLLCLILGQRATHLYPLVAFGLVLWLLMSLYFGRV
jgi:hypothetical protein